MCNRSPFIQHQKLLDIWRNNKSKEDHDNYWSQVVNTTALIKEYLIDLPSSQDFNYIVPKVFDLDIFSGLEREVQTNQAVNMMQVTGHAGHMKLKDGSDTWSNILLQTLKCQTIYHLLDISINSDKLYYNIYREHLEFIKIGNEYYFSCNDGLHRTVLAKYILSHEEDTYLHNVKIINYS